MSGVPRDSTGKGQRIVKWHRTVSRPMAGLWNGERGCAGEEDRVLIVRTLDAVAPLGGAHGVGRADPVDRAGRGRRGARSRWRLLPRASLRAAARLAVPASRGRRARRADRDGGRRHALRERCHVEDAGAADLIAGIASWASAEVAGAGDRRLAPFRLRPGTADCRIWRAATPVFSRYSGGVCRPTRARVPQPAGAAPRRATFGRPARPDLWGSSSNATSMGRHWANLQVDLGRRGGEPLRAAAQANRHHREAWKEAGHRRGRASPEPASSRSSTTATGPAPEGGPRRDGLATDANTRAIFGRSCHRFWRAVKQLAAGEAIAAADILLLTVPNQLGVDYNAHAINILKFIARNRCADDRCWLEHYYFRVVQAFRPADWRTASLKVCTTS